MYDREKMGLPSWLVVVLDAAGFWGAWRYFLRQFEPSLNPNARRAEGDFLIEKEFHAEYKVKPVTKPTLDKLNFSLGIEKWQKAWA
ncbi:unnamed protein product [Dovyalis caffra]|uniref:Uncharacterized protein n=1 Tax=Dovyalis caffra TaxID=77055 RepID=A0AAV1RRX1_9ROSI|nr:unnamed protein product [Dovyalis caffra]